MTVFAIVEDYPSPKLAETIRRIFPGEHLRVSDGHWLVSAKKTAQEVSADLGLDKGSGYRGIMVLAVSAYFGLHSSDTWDWFKSRMES